MPTIEQIVSGLSAGGAEARPYIPRKERPVSGQEPIGVSVRVGRSEVVLLHSRRELWQDAEEPGKLEAMGR